MKRRQFELFFFLLFVLFFSASFSWAKHLPVWEVHAGLFGARLPHYRGSDSYRTPVFPFPALIYRGKRFKASDGKIQGLLYTSETVKLDISLAASLPASPDDNSARKEMPRLDTTFEIGPSLITRLWLSENKNTNISLELPIRAAFSINVGDSALRDHGWTFSPFISINHNYDNWKVDLSLGPLFATRRYHSYFYDVSTEYATLARPVYSTNGGYSGSRFTLSVDKHFKKLSLISFVRYDVLSNATFIDSPLVERSNNISVGFAVMWQIAKSKRTTSHSH